MDTQTTLEDVSDEIFFEIFDYLHAFHIFTAFASLNKRISSILQSIPLRICISKIYCRYQIDFLSSHLIFGAHQVISIEMSDSIRDDTSIISLLFNRHHFINLQSCKFMDIHPSTKLDNVIKQIKTLDKLVSFGIYHPSDESINESDRYELARAMLKHKSRFLRSVVLQYAYNYSDISNFTSIPSNLTSLYFYINGSTSTAFIHSILPILRLCCCVRYIRMIIKDDNPVNNNGPYVTISTPYIDENDLPILSQVISFDLILFAAWNCPTIAYLLRCMPNLQYFFFIFGSYGSRHVFPAELYNGYVWREILELYVPHLSKFEFHMSIGKANLPVDLNIVVDSFEYFVSKYSNWHMIIDEWKVNSKSPAEFLMLRTLNYQKRKSNMYTYMPLIPSAYFETRSTMGTIDDHYLFYENERDLRIYITPERPIITCSSPLFQQIIYLKLELPIIRSSLLSSLLDIVNFLESSDDDVQESVSCLPYFVHLSSLIEIEFGSSFNKYRWKHAQFILQACPNVINLNLLTALLISSKFIDNPSLFPVFKRIKLIETVLEDIYFPPSFAQKLVERFPSLVHIELQIFSLDSCVSIIDTFLCHLKNLSYIKLDYFENALLDYPFSRVNIIERRRQAFPMNIINEQMINVKNDGEIIEIWLN